LPHFGVYFAVYCYKTGFGVFRLVTLLVTM